MTIIVFLVLAVWGISAIARAIRDAKRRRAQERERQRQRAEAERMREEWQRQQAEAKAETARLIALEREQQRQRREQKRQAKEQARQAQEQVRQAEQLARHEERIARLEQQVTLAEREIAHYQPIVNELRTGYERVSGMVEHYEKLGLPCGGYKTQLERVNEKLYRMETKVIKAENTKQNAQRKLSA